jgi:hypothetical protein
MAIVGCISLVVFYKLLRKIFDKKIATIGLIFFAIAPWHIMKSRWGMDCNLFPDIILYAVFFIVRFLESGKMKNMYISAIFLGISAYSYATSYFFLPIFTLIILLYLLKNKKVTVINCIQILAIIFVISLPMILYVIINTFQLESFQFLITIPLLSQNRYEEVSSIFGKYFISTSLNNFITSIKILILQNDGLEWNAISIYGINYIISLPFTLIGIYNNFKTKDFKKWIINIWFIVAILLLFVIEPNINRINIIMIPIIYYSAIGICKVFEKVQWSKVFISIIYIGLFISFEISYFTTDSNLYLTFNNGIENVIEYAGAQDAHKIYFEYSFKEPYIYVCFYNKIDTNEFVNTVKYKNDIKGFDRVESFGKYNFYIPNEIDENEDAIYVLKAENENKYNFDESVFEKQYIDDFVVIGK